MDDILNNNYSSTNDNSNVSTGLKERFLLFFVGSYLLGAPLSSLKEVIEEPTVYPVPNTATFFKGLYNLRGQIVGLMDLRKRCAINEAQFQRPGTVVIVEGLSGLIGVIVDRVEGTLSLLSNQIHQIQANESCESTILQWCKDSIIGEAAYEEFNVILIDIIKAVNKEDFREHNFAQQNPN